MKTILLCLASLLFLNCSGQKSCQSAADIKRIEKDLREIIQEKGYRNYKNTGVLDSIAEYIFSELAKVCDTAYFQNYTVDDKSYKNVIGVIGCAHKPVLIVGAHYDVAGDQPGADDNASGVAGMLELARLLQGDSLRYRLEFVAFTLEEPPFYKTKQMGSYVHAASLNAGNVHVEGMVCLEMIGYYNDNINSQNYPVKFLRLFYGNKGNFITVVQKFDNGKFGRKFKRNMKKIKLIKTKSFKAPAKFPGVGFSDHRNYWEFGYNAVMVTNTAFYRNKNYHKSTDTIETLDLHRMSNVINSVYFTLIGI